MKQVAGSNKCEKSCKVNHCGSSRTSWHQNIASHPGFFTSRHRQSSWTSRHQDIAGHPGPHETKTSRVPWQIATLRHRKPYDELWHQDVASPMMNRDSMTSRGLGRIIKMSRTPRDSRHQDVASSMTTCNTRTLRASWWITKSGPRDPMMNFATPKPCESHDKSRQQYLASPMKRPDTKISWSPICLATIHLAEPIRLVTFYLASP